MADQTQFQKPSSNPADVESLPGVIRFAMQKQLQSTDDMLPAKVIAYDRTKNLATVQPMLKILTTEKELVSRAPIASVPVLALGGGGFVVNFPLQPGDLGWIKASDRDISLYLQSAGGEAPPNTKRMHSFSDGLFIPDVLAQYTIQAGDEASMVVQSLDGTVRIALSSTKLSMFAPTVEIVGDTEVSVDAPTVNVTCTDLNVTAPLSTFTGNVVVTGTITGQTDVIADTIELKDHVHDGVQTGSADSGGPKNP